jgi:hypothetical protein
VPAPTPETPRPRLSPHRGRASRKPGKRIPQVPGLGPDDFQRARPAPATRPRSSSTWPAAIRSAATSFSAATSSSLWAEPRCSICRDPRREDHTTWTAVAPEVVRTVRTYTTAAGYGHRLVRKFSPVRPLQASKHGNPLTRSRSIDRSQVIIWTIWFGPSSWRSCNDWVFCTVWPTLG